MRASWLRDTLVDDNRVYLSREPEAVAEKWQAMADAPYDFLRGGLGVWLADLRRPVEGRPVTGFLTLPDATAVLLFGDAHPENLSTTCATPNDVAPEPSVTVEIIDLDAAQFGPWTWELRRAGAGLALLFAPLRPDSAAPWTDALVGGWSAGFDGGGAAPRGRILRGLVDEANDEGPSRKRLRKYTKSASGSSRFDLLADPRIEAPTPTDWGYLDVVLPELSLPVDHVVLDVVARRGAGVSSLPALRYWLLVGPPAGPAEEILELREVVDAPAYPRATVPGPVWAGHPARLTAAARHLWSRPDADPHAQAHAAGGLAFKVLTRSSWQQDLDRADIEAAIADGELGEDDARELAADLGRVLGAAHARSVLADGRAARAAIAADLAAGGGLPALRAELAEAASADAARAIADTALLRSLIRDHGPLLGSDELPREAP